MKSWQRVWREGVAPLFSLEQLESLRKALADDDPRLTQGSTTTPPPLMSVQSWPCEAACLMAWPGWRRDNEQTVGEVEEGFARMCYDADKRLGEPAECRWLMNWFDDTPRDEMRRELLAEVVRSIGLRLTGGTCDVCDQSGTEQNPVARVPSSAGETFAHVECPK